MKTMSLEELRAQARLTYRYWHLYLVLRLREVTQHLSATQREELGDITPPNALMGLLHTHGLLSGEENFPLIPPPDALELPDRTLFFQRIDTSLYAMSGDHQLELMRVEASFLDYIEEAATVLNGLLTTLDAETVLAMARYWAVLQGASVLNWQPSTLETRTQTGQTPLLPARKRGKGAFRDANQGS